MPTKNTIAPLLFLIIIKENWDSCGIFCFYRCHYYTVNNCVLTHLDSCKVTIKQKLYWLKQTFIYSACQTKKRAYQVQQCVG